MGVTPPKCLILAVILAIILCGTHAKSIEVADNESGLSVLPVVALVIILSVCFIVMLLGCNLCDRNLSFKDLEEDEVITAPPITASANSEFSMYPPVESTPETVGVIFEPLPDLSKLRPRVSNATRLRPKLRFSTAKALIRADSDEDLDQTSLADATQDKIKLQALLTNSRNQLPRSKLQYIKELGSGYFGKVLQGEGQGILPGHKKTKVVIQILKEEAESHDQLTFLMEATPFREVDHPNVMKVFGQCVETSPYLVVLELCPFGDLKTYLRSHRIAMESLNEKGLLLRFASDILAGLQALHQLNFVHHDLAIRNCQLASDLSVKIGDYGLSEENFKEDYFIDGNQDAIPIRWLAPESMGHNQEGALILRPFTKEANIWSYGVMLWEIMQFGAMPYADLHNDLVLRLVVKEKSVTLPKPDSPINHVDRLYELMKLCWVSPVHRPSLRELRIMLLHLLSSKGADSDSTAFDKKWNQLMPRKPASVVDVNQSPLRTVAKTESMAPSNGPVAPQGFESDFTPLDASHLNNVDKVNDVSTPQNELSLSAELSAASEPHILEDEGLINTNVSNVEQTTIDCDTPIILEDQPSSAVPDIVESIQFSDQSPDFMTSTPCKDRESSASPTLEAEFATSTPCKDKDIEAEFSPFVSGDSDGGSIGGDKEENGGIISGDTEVNVGSTTQSDETGYDTALTHLGKSQEKSGDAVDQSNDEDKSHEHEGSEERSFSALLKTVPSMDDSRSGTDYGEMVSAPSIPEEEDHT